VRRDLFHYDLPAELIAQRPPLRRCDARLLTLDAAAGAIADRRFPDIVTLVDPGDLLVFNDTRVIPARLFGVKQTGGRVELLVERVLDGDEILAHIRSSKSPKIGSVLTIGDEYRFRVVGKEGDLFRLVNGSESAVARIMQRVGHVPLPPYIRRDDTSVDVERYQTIYSRVPGAVAAPTAGLHFDAALMRTLAENGVDIGFVTLHVGAGTFQPVRSARVEDHRMHAEYFDVTDQLCRQVECARAAGRRIIAVGTTAVRALESAAPDGRLRARRGDTDIFIYPGYRFQMVDAMITNFHLPESTLLMLVAAFAGRARVMAAYRHAIRQAYRFFSYGDAMWLTRS
jgi:S-adenosylmethionine:tRNA ribosyltransferase-isomerase